MTSVLLNHSLIIAFGTEEDLLGLWRSFLDSHVEPPPRAKEGCPGAMGLALKPWGLPGSHVVCLGATGLALEPWGLPYSYRGSP